MKQEEEPRSPAEIAEQLGISEEEFRAKAEKQVAEFFRKEGIGGPELTQREREELEKQAKVDSEAFNKRFLHFPDWPPFPLPDRYNDDDPHLVGAAIAALQRLRGNYMPEVSFFGEQLKAAVEVALAVRIAWTHNDLDLGDVPPATNREWPVEQDFITLEQWFVGASAAIEKGIASGSEPDGVQRGCARRVFSVNVVVAVLLGLLLVGIYEITIHSIPWKWLVEHPNSIALQIGGSMILFFGSVGLFVPSLRKWFWGVGVFGIFLALLGLLKG